MTYISWETNGPDATGELDGKPPCPDCGDGTIRFIADRMGVMKLGEGPTDIYQCWKCGRMYSATRKWEPFRDMLKNKDRYR